MAKRIVNTKSDKAAKNKDSVGLIKRLKQTDRKKLFSNAIVVGLVLLVTMGAMAQMGLLPHTDKQTGKNYGWFGNEASANTANSWNPFANPTPTPGLWLSKEYIHAGDRLLAVEERGVGAPPPPNWCQTPSGKWVEDCYGPESNSSPTPPVHTLSATPNSVFSGALLTVSWIAPTGSSTTDWIGLYKVGDPNGSYIHWQNTNGATSGTLTFTAPPMGGQYEFRYLLNDGFNSVVSSNPVTVTALPACSENFGDDFNDGSINSSNWTQFEASPNNGSPVYERNGVLEIEGTTHSTENTHAGYMSNCGVSIVGTTITAEIVQPTTTNGNGGQVAVVGMGNETTMFAVMVVNGYITYYDQTSVYDVNQDRWVRVRDDPVSKTIYFEGSGDGTNWNVRGSFYRGDNYNSFSAPIAMLGGTQAGSTGVNTVKFDNFTYTNTNHTASCNENFSDDFNNSIPDNLRWNVLKASTTNSSPLYERNGVLEIAGISHTTENTHAGYLSNCSYPIVGTTLVTKLVQGTTNNGTGGNMVYFGFVTETGGDFAIFTSANYITFYDQTFTYNPTTDKWLRIRDDVGTQTVYFESSPDGTSSSWTVRSSFYRGSNYDTYSKQLGLAGGTTAGYTGVNTVKFDDFSYSNTNNQP